MAFAYDLSSSTLQVLDDRTRLKDSLQNRVSRISVEAAYGMPRLCEIEATPPFPVGAVGDVISIFAYAPGNLTGDIVFRGIVKSREIRMDAAFGSRYVIRAYDGAYDMTAQKKTRGFKDMTYGEVAKQIAKSYGLDPLLGSKIQILNPDGTTLKEFSPAELMKNADAINQLLEGLGGADGH